MSCKIHEAMNLKTLARLGRWEGLQADLTQFIRRSESPILTLAATTLRDSDHAVEKDSTIDELFQSAHLEETFQMVERICHEFLQLRGRTVPEKAANEAEEDEAEEEDNDAQELLRLVQVARRIHTKI